MRARGDRAARLSPQPYGALAVRQATWTLAYLTPDITNVAFLRTFRAIETIARARGYAVFLLGTDGSVEMTQEAIDKVIGLRMDGAFFTLSWVMSHPDIGLAQLTQRGIAMVGVSGSYDMPGIDRFLHDEEGGVARSEHICIAGHRRILLVGPTTSRAAEKAGRVLWRLGDATGQRCGYRTRCDRRICRRGRR